MSAPDQYQWRRDKDGLSAWEHRREVAAVVGHSPVDRRWDGVSMDQTLGAYSILTCRKAMDEAGVTPDQVDGVICRDNHFATHVVIEAGRLNRRMPDQPQNLTLVTLDADPRVNFHSNPPSTLDARMAVLFSSSLASEH